MKLTPKDKKVISKYGKYFHNTGGNEICELIERTGVNYFNNPIVCELQGSAVSQLILLNKLIHDGLLKEDE